MTGIDGVEFDHAWMNKVGVLIENLEIYVLSKADLLTNKLAAGREQDQGTSPGLR
jgi:hypothetical protein